MSGLNRAYKRRPNAVALNGDPVLCLDAGSGISYPGTGTAWTDLSGNANNGTLVNGPTFDSANGGSLVFDGVNDYVNCGTRTFNITNSLTLSIWAKFNTLSNGQIYSMFSYGGYISGGFVVQRGDSNSFRFAYNGSFFTDGQSMTTTNIWFNIVFVATQGQPVDFYLNTSKTSSSTLPSVSLSSSNTVEIGRRTDITSQYVSGNFGQINIYNRALSATEITTNFELLRGRYGV